LAQALHRRTLSHTQSLCDVLPKTQSYATLVSSSAVRALSNRINRTSAIQRALRLGHWALTGAAKRLAADAWHPRRSTNRVLRAYLSIFGGEIINISGWEDRDKEGSFYRDYFGARTRYVVSNIGGETGMPRTMPGDVESIYLNLDRPLPSELQGAFDVAFSHTVAEHVFDPHRTFEALTSLSRDVVITVVPFAQGVHYTSSYGDYVRLTPLFLKRFFEGRGFTVLLSVSNDQPFLPVYTVFIASRQPSRHEPHFVDAPLEFEPQLTGGRFGRRVVTGLNAPAD
jgi:hypothetical protein